MNTEHFTLHEIVAGVWAAEADLGGASVGNAAIIDAGGKTIVVDTFMTDVAARELRQAAEELTGNRVYLAVNSHWHEDHTGGNHVFADVPIVSTSTTMEQVAENAPNDIGAWQAEIDTAIDSLTAAVEAGDKAAAKRLDQQRHIRNHADNFKLVLPDLLIDGRLVIEGERRVEIETQGGGHTVSDTFVWLPAERVLVTGDLCWNGIHPRMHDGFPAAWAEYSESLIGLDPSHVIPGHGVPGTIDALRDLPDYFRAVDGIVAEVQAGATPTDFEAPAGSTDWAGITRFHDGIRVLADR